MASAKELYVEILEKGRLHWAYVATVGAIVIAVALIGLAAHRIPTFEPMPTPTASVTGQPTEAASGGVGGLATTAPAPTQT